MASNQPPAHGGPQAQYTQNQTSLALGYSGNHNSWTDRVRDLQQARYLWMMHTNCFQNDPFFAQTLTQNNPANTLINIPSFQATQAPLILPRPPQVFHPVPEPIPASTASSASVGLSPEPIPLELSKERAEQIFQSSLHRLQADGADFLNLQYWVDFASDCFSDEACYRHQYLSDTKDNHDFSADFDLLPFMLRMPYSCGALKIRFSLDRPSFVSQDGLHQLSYACCYIFTDYPSACVKSMSSLLVTFENDGKMLAWDFTTFDNEEMILRSKVNPPLSPDTLNTHFRPKSKRLLQRLQMMRDVATVLTLVENMDSICVDSSDDEDMPNMSALTTSSKYPTPLELSTRASLASAPRIFNQKESANGSSPHDPTPSKKLLPTDLDHPTQTPLNNFEPATKKVRARKPKGTGANSKKAKLSLPEN
ncbi:hypothetical protein DSO57_1020950 [Entomophthora muscae]|uniref:Uncharacterized protein n=1 Tax=Entomophthora muscae TaxID=34485 RepID=A0ACC2SSE8_9FUNG|nr:hypothetical protein DSO57_1020950 [Entomophthora muscae]